MSIFRYKCVNEDLGQTLVENLFINHYMPEAPGNFVKVYLLGLKYAHSQSQNFLSNETIAKTLFINSDIVWQAWKFWEEQGIIRLYNVAPKPDEELIVEFLSLKEKMLNIKDAPVVLDKHNPERIISPENDPRIRSMYKSLERIKGQPLSPTEMFAFLDCIEEYRMTPELVVKILEYCYEKDIRSLNYFKQTAKGWYDDGITTVDQADAYLEKHKDRWKKFNLVSKFFKMQNPINEFQEKLLHKWFYEYNFSDELVLKACELIGRNVKPNFEQIDRTITAWHEAGLKSLAEVEANLLKAPQESKKTKESNGVGGKTNFNNFANRTYDNKALKEQWIKKSRGDLSE